jgi:hypothetical protein
MDAEELKNLKKYLYILCEKIGKIQRGTGNDDKKKEFIKEYKLCFLLFVHKIYEYRNSLALSEEDDFKAIPLIKEINKLYKEKITYVKSRQLVEAEKLIEDKKELITKHDLYLGKSKSSTVRVDLSSFENKYKGDLSEIKDANETIKNAEKEKAKKETDIDNTIDSLLSRILGNTTGRGVFTSETDLNKQLYGNTDIETNTDKLKISGEIDRVKALLNSDNGLSTYYSFINKIIHKINPNISTSTDVKVKEYVNKYFKTTSVSDKINDDNEDLKIRKVFMIYLINNVIYYYIILKYDDAPCDRKIRFIFNNRYIKFSNIEMVAPQTNKQYTVLNKDIIDIFKNGTHLFDLMNNILEYEHHYLLTCKDYNKSIQKEVEAEVEEVYKNEPALKKYKELSEKYNIAYKGYVSSFEAYETANLEYELANGKNLGLLKSKDANAATAKEVAKKKNEDVGEALRSAVYTFNELLFCCFCKYIEINFKNRIDKLTTEYKEKLSKYLALIKSYNENCDKCGVKYNEGNYEDALNLLTKELKKAIDEQVIFLLKANDKEGKSTAKNAMNGIINTVIEIERRLEDIYKAFYENPRIFLSTSYDKKNVSKEDMGSIEYIYTIKNKDPLTMTYSQVMDLIIGKLKTAGYKNGDILSIYTTLKDIVDNKIKIKELTFTEIKRCCLDVEFMNRETFVVDDDTGILALIYSEAIESIKRLIEGYKEVYGKIDTTNDNASVKIEAYIKLIEDIKGVEQEAQKKKEDALNLLNEARKKAMKASDLTQQTKGDIDKLSSLIDSKIRIVEKYLDEEQERYERYDERIKARIEEHNITFDSVDIRNDRIRQRDESKRKIRNIRDKKTRLDGFIILAITFAKTAQQKAYINGVYKLNTLNTLNTIDGIKERLNDAILTAGDAILHNKNAGDVLDEIKKLLGEIEPNIIIINGLTGYIRKLEEEEELRERQELEDSKRVADDSVGVAINVGNAITEVIDKEEREERERRERQELEEIKGVADDSVGVAINVGNAITEVIDKQEEEEKELRESKIVADDSVGVAIKIGKAITDTIDKEEKERQELEDSKIVADDSVKVAIGVGNAIADTIDKQEKEEKELEDIKNASDNSVGVAINVGNAISDTIEKQEKEEKELRDIKNASDDSVKVAINVGNAISDTIDKQEEEEKELRELEDIKNASDNSVKVAIGVGNAITDTIDKQEEEEKELRDIKNASDNSVGVAINVGNAISDTIEKQEKEEKELRELEDIKKASDNSVEVAIDVAKQIKDPPIPQPLSVISEEEEEAEPAEEESEAEQEEEEQEQEEEEQEEAEIKPVKVKRRIDEEYVKGNYLYPGLFNEVKEDDLKAIREYHAEQVRNKFRAKPGAIAKMDAEIDKYNYQQFGGGTDGTADDMIKRLNNFENDINNPIEAFEIKFEDRLVFIITTFFLRYISISIIQRGIDSNMVKTFYEGFIYYGVIYILLFWFIVLFINIDNNYTIDYIDVNNLAIYIRSVFYYFYMGTNGISRLVIHSLLILLIIIIPIILNIKNTKARDMLNEDDEDEVKLLSLEERTKLSKALSLFTLFIWILTSIIASKF